MNDVDVVSFMGLWVKCGQRGSHAGTKKPRERQLDGEGSDDRPRKDVTKRYSVLLRCIEESATQPISNSVGTYPPNYPTIPLKPLQT